MQGKTQDWHRRPCRMGRLLQSALSSTDTPATRGAERRRAEIRRSRARGKCVCVREKSVLVEADSAVPGDQPRGLRAHELSAQRESKGARASSCCLAPQSESRALLRSRRRSYSSSESSRLLRPLLLRRSSSESSRRRSRRRSRSSSSRRRSRERSRTGERERSRPP
mmetsp:Transcript_27459/g.57832  ORF Transcript_27459/g.57832 Transcript_27459/m.57832 type:complete len:167 (+) Transcript_27459:1588-2088(+)